MQILKSGQADAARFRQPANMILHLSGTRASRSLTRKDQAERIAFALRQFRAANAVRASHLT